MVGKVFRNKTKHFSIELMQKTNLLCPFVTHSFNVPYEFTKHTPQQIICVEFSVKSKAGYLVFVVLFNDFTLQRLNIKLNPNSSEKYQV